MYVTIAPIKRKGPNGIRLSFFFINSIVYISAVTLDINKEINELNTPSVKPISIISLMSPSPCYSFLYIFLFIIFSKYININIKVPDSIWLKNELTPKNFK